MRLKKLISLPLLLLSIFCFSQKNIELNTQNGLSQNSVMCQYLDHHGFLWIGTQEGLNRFDGKNIKVYRSIPLDSNSISDDFIIDIHGDSSGNIYLATRSGLCYFNSAYPLVKRLYSIENERKKYHTNYFFCLALQNGKVFSANSEKIVLHDINNNKLLSWESKSIRVNTRPALYKNGILLFANDSCMYHFLENGERVKINLNDPFKNAKGSISFNNKLLFYSDSCISENIIQNDKIIRTQLIKLNEKIIQLKNRNGNIYVLTNKNLYRIQTNLILKPVIKGFSINPSGIEIINSNSYSIATNTNGINLWNENNQIFENFGIKNLRINDTINKEFTVWSMINFQNNFIIGTSKGLFINQNLSEFKLLELPNKLSKKTYSSSTIYKDFLVLGNTDEEIIILNKNNELIKLLKLNMFEGKNVPFKLVPYKDKLLIVSSGGIFYLNENFEIDRFIKLKDLNPNLSEYCLSLYIDSKNNFWFGGTRSLLLSKDNFKKNIYIKHDPTNPNTISHFIISCFEEWPNQGVLVGTLGAGINLIDYNGNIIKKFNPLPQSGYRVIYSIYREGNKIWASTNSGIISFDLSNDQFRTYNKNDGINVIEYSQHSAYFLNNHLYLGGVNGFVKFNPANSWIDTNKSKIIIEDITINFNLINPAENIVGNALFPQKIKLFPKDKNITISPTITDLIRGDEYKIFYRVKELDENWIELKNKNDKIFFNYLAPGKYSLEIKALGPNHEPLNNILIIEIISIPPFYLTLWFRIIILILFSILLILVVKQISNRKLRKKLKEIEIENKIKTEKERISRDLHDNVGSQISYLIWSLDDLEIKASKNQIIDPRKIENIGDQARETMHQLRDTIWALDKDSLSLEEFLNKIELLLIRITDHNSRLNFEIINTIPQGKIIFNTSESVYLYRIIQEFANNTLKYAKAKKLLLKFSFNNLENTFIFEISDNGIGFDMESSKNKGNGLKNITDRCNEIFWDFTFDSKPDLGTILIIKINKNGSQN